MFLLFKQGSYHFEARGGQILIDGLECKSQGYQANNPVRKAGSYFENRPKNLSRYVMGETF